MTGRLNQPPRDPLFIFEKRWDQPQRDLPLTILSYTYKVTNEEQLYHEEIIVKEEGYLMGFHYVRGLMGFWFSHNGQLRFRIHNPTTSQSLVLPITSLPGSLFYLFGYDPFKNQYKVLCLTQGRPQQSCKLFILGDVSKEWRDIQCSIGIHFFFVQAICINGTIYYSARNVDGTHVLVSFDVRHEKFNLVQTPDNLLFHYHDDTTLVNYHGKLGCICPSNFTYKAMDLWVMQDGEKQEWSQVTFLDMLHGLPYSNIKFAGVTNPGGEIVLVHKDYHSELALQVYYYDPKQNALRRAEIKTTRPSNPVTIRAVTDHPFVISLL